MLVVTIQVAKELLLAVEEQGLQVQEHKVV